MPTQKLPSQQRISKSTGRVMIGVAIFFDLVPVGLVVLMLSILMFGVMDSIGGNLDSMNKANATYEECRKNLGDTALDVDPCDLALGTNTIYNKSSIGLKAMGGVGAILGIGVFIGPIVYTIGSFLASTIAYIVFIIWFYVKGVHVLSFGSGERVMVNLMSVVIEYLPVVNLLPSITFGVWRHIKVSRAEDKIKDSELFSKASKAMNRLAYA